MALLYRIEVAPHPTDGTYRAELYVPADAAEPIEVTDYIYPTADVAQQDMLGVVKGAFTAVSNKP